VGPPPPLAVAIISTMDSRNARCGSRVRRTTARPSSSAGAARRGDRTRTRGGCILPEKDGLRPPLTLRRRLLRRRRCRLAPAPAASVSDGAAAARAGEPARREKGIRRPSGGSSRSPPTEQWRRPCRRAATESALSLPTDSRRGTAASAVERRGGLDEPGVTVTAAGLGLVRLGRHDDGNAGSAAAVFLGVGVGVDARFAAALGFSLAASLASQDRGENENALPLPLLPLSAFSPSHRADGAACCLRMPHVMAR